MGNRLGVVRELLENKVHRVPDHNNNIVGNKENRYVRLKYQNADRTDSVNSDCKLEVFLNEL